MKKKKVLKKKTTKSSKKSIKGKNPMDTNSLSVKASSEVANMADVSAWGSQELSSQDIVIPRLLIMQGMSEMVTEGKAKFGDIIDNLEEAVVGSFDTPVEIIPFKLERVWRVQKAAGKGELIRTIPIVSNPESPDFNDNMPYDDADKETGEAIRNFRAFRYYVVLAKDVEEGTFTLPYMVEFKSTSLKAGKKLATTMYTKNRAAGLSPAARVFELSLSKQSNDNGTFAVFDVKATRASNKDEQSHAFDWFKQLGGGNFKVSEEG